MATAAAGAAAATVAAGVAITMGPVGVAIPLALALCLLLIREPLALLTLFVYIGLFKEQGVVKALPFDITGGLGVLLVGVCFSRFASGRARTVPLGLVAPVAVIAVMLVISLHWTPSPEYGTDKTVKFVTLTLLAMLAPFFLIESQRDVRRYLAWLIVVAVLAAAVTVIHPPADSNRLTIGSLGNTIGVSQLMCTAAAILLVGALTDVLPARLWAVALALGLMAVAAAVGSRGPLFSLAIALVATGAVWLARVPRKVLPVLGVVVVGVALLPFISLPQASSQRLGRAVRDPVGSLRADARSTTFGEAINLIKDHPLVGVGAGGFQSVGTLAHPPEDYPHNLFLEVWSELGLAASTALITSIIFVLSDIWRGAWRLAPRPGGGLLYVVSAVVVFNLLAAQVSGDINENRAFWVSFGLAWLLVRHGGLLTPPLRGDAHA